jgi:hypothetical protein
MGMPNRGNGYIRALEMSGFLSYRWCFYTIYGVTLLKIFGYFIISFSQNVKEKVYPKVFWVFKNGQKKCPKMKKGEILWEKHDL